jgi:uncharacterized membrane protein YgcG
MSPAGRPQGGSSSARRFALVLQILGAAVAVAAVLVGVLASHASAAPLSNANVALKVSLNGPVATSPLADQHQVNIVVSANSALNRSALEAAGFPSGAVAVKVLECADPNGETAQLPKSAKDCDANTIRATTELHEDGSLLFEGFTVYALPDDALLGPGNGTTCDAQHECVIGIFTNQNDLTKPHLYSAPFVVASTGSGSTANSGAGTGSTSGSSPSTSGGSSSGSPANGSSSVGLTGQATLANTGGPTLWPWLLGAGAILLVAGSVLRYRFRGTGAGRAGSRAA